MLTLIPRWRSLRVRLTLAILSLVLATLWITAFVATSSGQWS